MTLKSGVMFIDNSCVVALVGLKVVKLKYTVCKTWNQPTKYSLHVSCFASTVKLFPTNFLVKVEMLEITP